MHIRFTNSIAAPYRKTVVASAPENLPTAVTITPLTYDRWVYDSGAARGLNQANFPISGNATGEGTSIIARVVRADNGAPVTAWGEVSTVAGGVYFGTVPCPRSPHDLRIEVKVDGGTTVLTPSDKRYVSGHKIAVWGQSWYAGLFSFRETTPFDQTLPGAVYSVDNPNTLQLIGQETSATLATTPNPQRVFVQNDSLVNDGTVRFANLLNANSSDRFCIVVHARGATGITDFMDDSASPATERTWSTDDEPVHNLSITNGAHIGTVMLDWYHNLATTHLDNADLLHLFVFSELADGTARQSTVAAGSSQTFSGLGQGAGATYAFDRSLADIYDWPTTRLILNGPNRHELANFSRNGQPEDPSAWTYDANQPQAMSLTDATFAPSPAALGREQVRYAYERLALKAEVVTRGIQGNHIYCAAVDEQHPATTFNGSEDGDAEFEKYTAYALLEGHGIVAEVVSGDAPRISGAVYTSDYIEVSFENDDGPVDITTTRLLRGETQDPARPAHQTQVMGFEIAGLPVGQADVVNGKVRIYPLAGAPTVTLNDFGLQFGRGVGAGQLGHFDDLLLQSWKEFPGWAKPTLSANAEGARIIPAQVPSEFGAFPITNTLDVAPGVYTRPDGTTTIESPGTLSAILWGKYSGTQQILSKGTAEFVGAIPDATATTSGLNLFQLSSSVSIRLDTRPTKRQTIASGGGLTLLRSPNLSYTPDQLTTFRVSWDAGEGLCWLDVDGVTVTEPYSGTGEEMNDLTLLNFADRSGLQMKSFKLWDTVSESAPGVQDGGVPSEVPILVISGGSSYIDDHPWLNP